MIAVKTTFTTIILFCFVIQVQGQCIINGRILDTSGDPVPFANALLLKSMDSILVKGTIASEDGTYRFTGISPGDYFLKLNMIGYRENYISPVSISSTERTKDLGDNVLEEYSEELGEVLLEGKKPLFEQQIDRLVINVDKSVTSVGGTALDVLEKAPGISVNRQVGSLSMGGKAGVLVMINGKINRLPPEAVIQLLSGINAANITTIELITSPPAKYDAEGDAGIINIVLKENTNFGTNGSLSLTGGYGDEEKAVASINLNHRARKVNFYGDYSFNRNNTTGLWNNSRTLEHQGEIITTSMSSARDPLVTHQTARLGMDLYVGDKTVVGANASGFSRLWVMDAVNTSLVSSSTGSLNQVDLYLQEENLFWNLSGAFHISHSFTENNVLSFYLDYLYYKNENPSDYINEYLESPDQEYLQEEIEVRKDTPMEIWVASLDHSFGLGKNVLVETGIKASVSRFTNDVSVQSNTGPQWVINPDLTSVHDLREEIGAAYISFRTELFSGFSLNGGLRYEYTRSKLDSEEEQGIIDRKYGEFFPNFALAQKFNEDHNLVLSYSRRITRPRFNDLAPFVIFLDPYTFFSGNPALQPAFTQQVKLDYSFRKFLLSLQYSYDKNPIDAFQSEIDPVTNIQILGAQNLDFTKTYTVNVLLPVSIGKLWEMENNILAYHQTLQMDFHEDQIQQELLSLQLKSTQRFLLPRNYTIEISGNYLSPFFGGIIEYQAQGSVNAAVQKKFKENRGSLTLSYNDIFWTDVWRGQADVPQQNVSLYWEYFFEPRVLLLTYSRNFGNRKLKPITEKTGAEEERGRVE